MNIAAYCRVSTDKEDQLNSLEAQKDFFCTYARQHGDNLVGLYADEGLSGTKTRNRREFLRMMADAETGRFQRVVVKDISRFARNTVDLLQNIRRLKALGIETQFLTANMTSMGESEFVLTLFGALAQEESANTSKRVKFGKRRNAEQGRVPNLVYGYDKTPGDCFHLSINETEAAVVRRIFAWYVQEGCGAAKIAQRLNAGGLRTKRGSLWSQNAVRRILTNPLYTGEVVNGKQEVADFLTGRRTDRDRADWLVVPRPELRLVEPALFARAGELMAARGRAFQTEHTRQSSRYLFSTLIRCKECGRAFRRTVRTYRNTYVRWVCSTHSGTGASACPNGCAVDEEELLSVLENYFTDILQNKGDPCLQLTRALSRSLGERAPAGADPDGLRGQIAKVRSARQKYLELYAGGLITREELEGNLSGLGARLEELERAQVRSQGGADPAGGIEALIREVFPHDPARLSLRTLNNQQLRALIQVIQVDREGHVDICLRALDPKSAPLRDAGT